MVYYSAIKKNEILPFTTMWMELEGIMLSEISQRKANMWKELEGIMLSEISQRKIKII